MSLTRVQPGATIGGKYRLEAPLARGGMGSVWTAQHVELGVPVAIKFMDLTFASSPQAQARFAREAKAAAGLRHPNIVDVRDYGLDGGLPYLVMELLRGEDLGVRLHRVRRLSLQDTAAMLSQIARALRGAHEAGIVHRDLKPGNVFLARVDDEEVVKILDFGIAKDTTSAAVAGESTRTGEIVGSPHFMSPEQVRGAKNLDARSDIWALGVIVFRCLTGRLPFNADVIGAVIGQILADPIPTATSVAPDLPPEVDAFFARVFVRDREGRYASARDMANALSMIAGLTPRAMSVSAAYGAPAPVAPPMQPTPQPWYPAPPTPAATPAPSYASGPLGSGPFPPPQAYASGTQAMHTPPALTPASGPFLAPQPLQAGSQAGPGPQADPSRSGALAAGTLTSAGGTIPAPSPRSGRAAVIVIAAAVVLGCGVGAALFLHAQGAARPAAAPVAAERAPTTKPPPAPTASPAPAVEAPKPQETATAAPAAPSASSSAHAPPPAPPVAEAPAPPSSPAPQAVAPAHKPASEAAKPPPTKKTNLPPVGF